MIHPWVPVFLIVVFVATFILYLKSQNSAEQGWGRFGGAVVAAIFLTALAYGFLWFGDYGLWPG